jgi:kynurenine formamidase
VSQLVLHVGGDRYAVDGQPVADLSLPLDFHGSQPSHFGAPRAQARPLEVGGFIGDTTQGGSCNCELVSFVPHCNGTHTECVGHVTADPVSITAFARDALLPALVLSVPTYRPDQCTESANPLPMADDRLVCAKALAEALGRCNREPQPAVVIRTLPNDPHKRTRDYARGESPAYLSLDAVDLLVGWGVRHLLVDLPSLDRAHDDGRLAGHRRFWGLPDKGVSSGDAIRGDATVTEMVFVPDEIEDGLYALSLQVAPFVADAAPSRPLLYALEPR